jgi:hypothetical protein
LLGDAKSSLGDAKSSLCDAKSSLCDAKSSLCDAKSSLGDAKSSLCDAKSSLCDAKSSQGFRTAADLGLLWVTASGRSRHPQHRRHHQAVPRHGVQPRSPGRGACRVRTLLSELSFGGNIKR